MRELTPRQAQALAETAGDAAPRPLFLDVREPWEVERAALRMPASDVRHIPMAALPGRLDELDPAQPVVCICHHGARSAQVVAFLERSGRVAYNLA
ncbi:MAG: rhodanese-like domain-containing protein, partial [Pseudomonadota bacterium]|nr:rhodanese-like domain-containing protein [Pseudomonadota bacterium]